MPFTVSPVKGFELEAIILEKNTKNLMMNYSSLAPKPQPVQLMPPTSGCANRIFATGLTLAPSIDSYGEPQEMEGE